MQKTVRNSRVAEFSGVADPCIIGNTISISCRDLRILPSLRHVVTAKNNGSVWENPESDIARVLLLTIILGPDFIQKSRILFLFNKYCKDFSIKITFWSITASNITLIVNYFNSDVKTSSNGIFLSNIVKIIAQNFSEFISAERLFNIDVVFPGCINGTTIFCLLPELEPTIGAVLTEA